LVAGFAVATLSIGWPLSSSLVGKLYLRTSFRTAVMCGGALATAAGLLLALTVESPSVTTVAVLAFFVGAGLGMGSVPAMVAAQSSVAWHERGVVTGAQMFARSAGSAIGVAVFGALANARIAAAGGPRDPQAIVAGTQMVFWAVVVVAAMILAAAALMPRQPVEGTS
jgi:MFS family permease